MPITVSEAWESRPGTFDGANNRKDLIYLVDGTDDDVAAQAAAIAAAPATYDGLPRIDGEIERIAEQMWKVVYHYGFGSSSYKAGDSEFKFDTSGGTVHITQSLETIANYVAPGWPAAPDFKGAVGVTKDAVEGVDIPSRNFAFSITKYIADADMSAAYINYLYTLSGKTNDDAWTCHAKGEALTFQRGEVLFLGAAGGPRLSESDWEIEFKFAASENVTGLVIGTITGVDKRGWEYLWIRYQDEEDAAAYDLVKRPTAAYVERVFREGDFDLLGAL